MKTILLCTALAASAVTSLIAFDFTEKQLEDNYIKHRTRLDAVTAKVTQAAESKISDPAQRKTIIETHAALVDSWDNEAKAQSAFSALLRFYFVPELIERADSEEHLLNELQKFHYYRQAERSMIMPAELSETYIEFIENSGKATNLIAEIGEDQVKEIARQKLKESSDLTTEYSEFSKRFRDALKFGEESATKQSIADALIDWEKAREQMITSSVRFFILMEVGVGNEAPQPALEKMFRQGHICESQEYWNDLIKQAASRMEWEKTKQEDAQKTAEEAEMNGGH